MAAARDQAARILRTEAGAPGAIHVRATSPGLQAAEITLESKQNPRPSTNPQR